MKNAAIFCEQFLQDREEGMTLTLPLLPYVDQLLRSFRKSDIFTPW